MTLKKRNTLIGRLLVLPLLAGCLLFYVLPIALTAYRSMMWGAGSNEAFVGLSNYGTIFQNPLLLRAVKNTLLFLLVSIPLILVVSYAIALFLNRCASRWNFLKSVLLLPYITPVVAVTLIVDLFFGDSGLVNQALSAGGLSTVDWLNSSASFTVIVLMSLWKNVGYSVIILSSGLATIPDEQYAAASLDGASAPKKFWYITVPQMRPSTLYALLFSLINVFKCFKEIFLIGGVHPNENIYMLQHFINNTMGKMGYSRTAAVSTLMLAFVMAAVAVLVWAMRLGGGRKQ